MWPQCCPNVAPMLPQCCPNVAPMWSNVAPMWSQCGPMWPQCGTNAAPMLPQWDPNVAHCCHQEVGVFILLGVHRRKFNNGAKTRKTGIINAVGMFAPQCGHNVVQCCPKVAPLLPHFCPNVALMLAHCCSNVVHCCPQCPQFGPSLASFERSHSSVGQSVRLITVRLRVQVSVDLLGSKWSLNSEIRMGHQCCPIVDPMWPQCCPIVGSV